MARLMRSSPWPLPARRRPRCAPPGVPVRALYRPGARPWHRRGGDRRGGGEAGCGALAGRERRLKVGEENLPEIPSPFSVFRCCRPGGRGLGPAGPWRGAIGTRAAGGDRHPPGRTGLFNKPTCSAGLRPPFRACQSCTAHAAAPLHLGPTVGSAPMLDGAPLEGAALARWRTFPRRPVLPCARIERGLPPPVLFPALRLVLAGCGEGGLPRPVSVLSEYEVEVHSPPPALRLPSVIALKEYIPAAGGRPSPASTCSCATISNASMRPRPPDAGTDFDHVVPRSKGGRTTWGQCS